MSSTTRQDADGRDLISAARGTGTSARHRPRLALVRTRLWSHTLILEGGLDDGAAGELDDELECLRQEGVGALTLDLRQLDALELGVARAIALQSRRFKGEGLHFSVLGSPAIHRAIVEAGGIAVSSTGSEGVAQRFPSSRSERASADVSTTMIRDMSAA
jgi:anti-anti-sigma regulatory factor